VIFWFENDLTSSTTKTHENTNKDDENEEEQKRGMPIMNDKMTTCNNRGVKKAHWKHQM
jgi:hypothetical protein